MNFILDHSNEKPFLYSKDSIVCKINDSFLDLTGYEGDEIIGKSIPQLMALLKVAASSYSDDIGLGKRCLMSTKDNLKKEVIISYESLIDENKKVFFIEECPLIEFETIIDNLSDRIVYFNNKGEYIYKNKILTDLDDSMFKDLDAVHKKFDFIDMNRSLIPYKNTPTQRILRGETLNNFTFCLVNKSNNIYYEVKGNPFYDNGNNIIGGVIICRDVGHRFKMEEYSLFKKNTNHIAFSYASLSYPDFNIVYLNEKAYKTIYSSHQNIDTISSMIGRNSFDYLSLGQHEKESLILSVYNAIHKEPYTYIYDHSFIANGEENYIKIIFQPMFGVDNNIQKIIALGIDVSPEVRAKKRLAQTLKEQEDLFLDISHELKTPLNIIFSSSQLLEMNLLNIDSCPQKHLIEQNSKSILQNTYRLTKLINNILDISKIESGFSKLSLQNLNIIKLVEDVVESILTYAEVKNLKIIFDTNVEEKIVACDPNKIERIILNLITNAIKFSDLNGIIYVNVFDKDDFIEISVRDEGIGIDKKHLDSIFEKFIQVKESLKVNPRGTGIGLPLVKSIVELHKGTISVESQLGEGSTFKFLLPNIIIENPINPDKICPSDIIESIKFEFSDIYC